MTTHIARPAPVRPARTLPAQLRPATTRTLPATLGSQAFLLLLALAFLAPVAWALVSAFKPATQIISDPLGLDLTALTLDNYVRMFADVPIGQGFLNTAVVLVLKGAITLFFAPLAAYAFAKYRFPGRDLLFGTVLITLMLPTIVLIIPLLLEMKALGWVNTYQALVLPGAVDAFAIFWMRQVIADVPDELLDAARVDGAGEFRTFFAVVLPQTKPALATLGILTFLGSWNNFLWPLVAVQSADRYTLPVALALYSTGQNTVQYGLLVAGATVIVLPILIVFLVLQRHIVQGISTTGLK
jgi:multiple sugar transport system permease protein